MADKCLIRVEKLLKGSSLKGNIKDEILSTIKKVQAEKKIAKLDDINVDAVAKDVKEQIKEMLSPAKQAEKTKPNACEMAASLKTPIKV